MPAIQTSWDRIKTGARKLPNAKKKPGKLLTGDRIMIAIEKGHCFIRKDGPSFNSPMFLNAQ